MGFQTQFIHSIPQNHDGAAAAAAAANKGIVGFNFCSCAVVVVPPGCGSLAVIQNAVCSVGTISNTPLSVFAEIGY